MMDMTKRVKVAMMDYIADLTGAGASQAELKIAIEMSKTVMDAMRSEQSKHTYCSPYFSTRRQAEEALEKMCAMIDRCDYVTLDYLNHLAGKKSCSLYEHYGWYDLSSAHIEFGSNRCLYYIVLPEIIELDTSSYNKRGVYYDVGEIIQGVPVPNNGMTIPKDSIPKLIEALEKYLKKDQNE